MKKNKKRIIIILLILLIVLGVMLTWFLYNKRKEELATYNAITFTSKNSIMYEEEWFETYWALQVDILEYKKPSRFIVDLEKRLEWRPNVTTVCLEIPLEGVDIMELEACIDSHPEITFFTYLEVKPLQFWSSYNQEDIVENEKTYNNISDVLVTHANVVHFEFYNLEWLLVNGRNFKESGAINTEVSKILFHSFTDRLNLYDGNSNVFSNGEISFFNEFEHRLEEKTVLVFGDSIWDLNRTSTGVESVMEEFSGLQIENLAISGSSASMVEGAPDFFAKVANDYVNREDLEVPDFILIEYGINDYFSQVPIENKDDLYDLETYGGGLRLGLELLQDKFPESEIILLGPTTILTCESGNLDISGAGTLRDYAHAMEDVATEFNVRYINNMNTYDLHISRADEYLLADQVHLNERGVLLYVRRVLHQMCNKREIKWYDEHFYIAHACGGIDTHEYTNSLEAFEQNYELGHRVFEVDLNFTSDDVLVAVHDWGNEKLKELYGIHRADALDGVPLSSEEFSKVSAYGEYTTMNFQDVIDLMIKYPDVYIVLDTKAFDQITIQKQYNSILNEILQYEDIAKRIIPQIYNQEMYYTVMNYYSWDSIIFTMYGVLDWKPDQIIDFCKEENIDVVTTFPGRAEASFIMSLKEQGQKIYMHTFNTMEEVNKMITMGADGIYTDYLYPGVK